MSRRIDRLNKHLQRTFSEILCEEAEVPDDVLVTVANVETAYNLRSATVWLSVFPMERAGAVVEDLNKQLYQLQGSLNRQLKLKILPRVYLKVDYGAQHAENIDRQLNKLT